MKLLLIALMVLFVCNTFVLAQTGIPTPGPGIIGEHGEFIQGAAVQVGPGKAIMTDRACQIAIIRALDVHAPVPVPVESKDPNCAEWMQKALTFQSHYPEPTGSPTP